MHEVYLNSVKDTLLVGVPFVAVLALGIFRLDTLIFSSKPTSRSARQGCGLSADGEPILVDPDGRLARRRKR
ncbi:MAG: hypothetical protein ABSF17_09985 [Terracidiphilus sp.]|jgi:hypothetical protein